MQSCQICLEQNPLIVTKQISHPFASSEVPKIDCFDIQRHKLKECTKLMDLCKLVSPIYKVKDL